MYCTCIGLTNPAFSRPHSAKHGRRADPGRLPANGRASPSPIGQRSRCNTYFDSSSVLRRLRCGALAPQDGRPFWARPAPESAPRSSSARQRMRRMAGLQTLAATRLTRQLRRFLARPLLRHPPFSRNLFCRPSRSPHRMRSSVRSTQPSRLEPRLSPVRSPLVRSCPARRTRPR
jgi:hypothetical protein